MEITSKCLKQVIMYFWKRIMKSIHILLIEDMSKWKPNKSLEMKNSIGLMKCPWNILEAY